MNPEELSPIRNALDAAGIQTTNAEGDHLPLHERVHLLIVKRDAAVQLCGELAEEKESARRDLDDAQAVLAERAAEIERLNAALRVAVQDIDALNRTCIEGQDREAAEARRADETSLQLASLQERAADLARAAQAVRAENEAMKAEAVELVPVAVHTDELATSLGRFPMLRHDLPGAVVVALRVLPGDAQLAQHFATEVRRVYPNAVVVVSREAPARTVRLFRVVPAGAQVVPLAPEPEQPQQRREQDGPGEPIPPPSVEDYTRALATQYQPEEVGEIVAAAQELADRQGADVRPILRDACRMAVAAPPASTILDAIRATGAVAPLASPATP